MISQQCFDLLFSKPAMFTETQTKMLYSV